MQKNIYIIAIIFTFSDIDILESEEYNKTKVNTINAMSKSKEIDAKGHRESAVGVS